MTKRWFPDDMPAPAASRETLPWWEAAAAHRLVVQRCTACRHPRHPPGPACPACHGFAFDWLESSGRGTVYSFTVVRRAFVPSLASRVPYVVAIVALDDVPGIRLVTNLVDVDPATVRIGIPVEVVWEDVGPGLALPRFRVASS
jgi:uncharacterized OB-fold protein